MGLLRCWGGAVIVWLVGIGATIPLRAKVSAEALSDLDLRSHLPWVVISVLMALVSGGLCRNRSGRAMRLAAVLPVPIVAAVVGAVAGFGGGTLTAAVLYVVEGLFSVVIGLFVTNMSNQHGPSGNYW
jgi:energy-converting hydrogenase Eha subunit A